MTIEETRQPSRRTGIDVLGTVPWGTHFCLFYKTKEDLIAILTPYFKAGLESNEFCMWVTSEPLSVKEAENALRNATPDFDQYLKKEQIQIVPHTEWYLKDGVFNLQRVLNDWIDKLNQALASGFAGMRVAGGGSGLEKGISKEFADYEKEVNKAIDKYRMVAICSYCIDECGASEIIDVVNCHQFAVIRREGKWEVIESAEHKKAEEALEESKEKLYRFMELVSDGFFLFDSELNYVYVNKAAVDSFGLTKQETIGKNILDVLPVLKETGRYDRYLEVIKTGKSFSIDDLVLGPEFGEKHINVRAFKLRDGLGIITRDITEQKRAEKILRETGKLAAKGQLAAQIAHEVNNPLAGIKNSFLLIKDAIPEDHPYYRYVGLIDKEIERISNIVRQMFDLYRPNKVTAKEFLVDETIHEVIHLLEVSCREHNVVITIDRRKGKAAVKLPEALLRQALFNIVKNAVEASPPGGEVKVVASVTKDVLTLTVSDHGSGIPEQAQSRVFEPSFTTKDGQTTGLGIGLSVSRSIIEGMGGSIHFESKADERTVFSIVIPLSEAGKEVQNG